MKIEEILNIINSKENAAFFYTPNLFKGGKSILFADSEIELETKSISEVNDILSEVESLRNKGFTGYGFINYEAGYTFEESLKHLAESCYDGPIIKFNFCKEENVKFFEENKIDFSGVPEILTKNKFVAEDFNISTPKDKYINDIEIIKDEIANGNTYQVNYTTNSSFKYIGKPEDLFLNLIFNQSALYSAYIKFGSKTILSISPELFFHQHGDKIVTRPMKGTIKRGLNLAEDKIRSRELRDSIKNRAENIMIVDLLRNDFGRISKFDKVTVDDVYKIEKYESLFQMTSSVVGQLKKNDIKTIIRNVFPCGSITGAPKISTMKIIKNLEARNRGVYTGSIGLLDKNSAHFNVAIRTIELDEKGNGQMGVGSGIVWDSDPLEEYEEAKLKGRFLTNPQNYSELFETMLYEDEEVKFLNEHLERLQNAAEFFLFKFDYESIKNEIVEYAKSLGESTYKIKIQLNKWGMAKFESAQIHNKLNHLKVILSEIKVDSQNRFQYFKTTNRELYNKEIKKYKELGFDEVIFLNELNAISEGSFTNIFIKKGNDIFTPPISAGILNGILREKMLQENKCMEKDLSLDDLRNADKLFLVNSVRGVMEVSELHISSSEVIEY